jgi:Initiator Replication protein
MGQVTKKTSHQLKAPQAIVHIKHSITLRQYKLWILLLQRYRECFEAQEEPDEDGFYRLGTADLSKLFGYEPNKDELRADFEKLRREPIIVNSLEKDGTPVLHGMGFVSEWKVSTKALRFKVPSLLQKVMQGLDQPKAIFQLINWEIFNHFTGKHEAIIYKLCRDYAGVKNTPYFTIEELREYLGLKPEEYPEFKQLNFYVITKAVNAINREQLSDITAQVHWRKEGRRVVGLFFEVARKRQQSIAFQEFEQNEAFNFAKITIEASSQAEYLALRAPEDVALCIERANEYGEQLAKQNKDVNYGAIYRSAIVEGWHVQYLQNQAKRKESRAKKMASVQTEQDAKRDDEMKLQTEKAESARIWAEFLTRPEAEQDALIRAVFEGKTVALASYLKKGKETQLVKSAVIVHLKALESSKTPPGTP